MKKKLILYSFLCFVLVYVFSNSVNATGVQTTYTKSNNVITVKAKPDANYSGEFTSFACTIKYLKGYSVSLAVTSSSYLPAFTVGTTITDPNDPLSYLTSFVLNSGTSTINWTSGSEYDLFAFTITNGLGTNPFSLVFKNQFPYSYGPYYELDNGTEIANTAVPFYAGTDNLTLSTSGIYKFATENLILGKYWLTTGTSGWSTGSNWSGGTAPVIGESVAILAGGTQPIAGAASVCNKLSVETGASVNVAYNGDLTVNSDLSVADNNGLVVASTAAGTGSLIVNGSVPSGNKTKVQRYVAAYGVIPDAGWHFLSSPVANQLINGNFIPTYNVEDFYGWDEPSYQWINYYGTAPTFPTWNGSSNFVVGRGYLVAYQSASTKEFVGTLNTSSPTVLLTKTGVDVNKIGWTLLGNPYSSALQWSNGSTPNVDANCQIWNEAGKSYSVISPSGIIPAMNGFMVHTNLDGQSFTLPTARTHSSTAWYKSSEIPRIKLIAHDPAGQSFQESLVAFNSNATSGFDSEYDSYYLGGYAPQFYSVTEGNHLGLNTLTSFTDGLVIPFVFVKNASSSFNIELAENLDGVYLSLRDKKTNTVVDLNQNPVYSFTSVDGDNANRFELMFGLHVNVTDYKALASATAYSTDNKIIVSNVSGITTMDIINVQGQVLNNYKFNSTGNHEISVNLPTGIYMVRLSNSGEIKTMKVFVK